MCGRVPPQEINLQMLSRAQTYASYSICTVIHNEQHHHLFLASFVRPLFRPRSDERALSDPRDTTPLIMPSYNLQLFVCTLSPLSLFLAGGRSAIFQHLQRWVGGDRWYDVGGHSENFPECWTLMIKESASEQKNIKEGTQSRIEDE